jgi:hypothetical protein
MTCYSNKTVCPHFHIAFQDILNYKFSQKKTRIGDPWTHTTHFLLQVVSKECHSCSLVSHHFARTVWELLQLSYTCHSYKCVDWKWIHISCAWLLTVKCQSQKTSSCNLPKYVWFPSLSPILLYQYYVKIISYISCVHPTCLNLDCVSSHLSLSVYCTLFEGHLYFSFTTNAHKMTTIWLLH